MGVRPSGLKLPSAWVGRAGGSPPAVLVGAQQPVPEDEDPTKVLIDIRDSWCTRWFAVTRTVERPRRRIAWLHPELVYSGCPPRP